ncbi:hypothetical protein RO3G_09438 [Rhizopus delemar RA 99-880]|uniref:Uncharacterized protein n=1 Tax=Rhizopus delemar (strain RA 99-880 / ATCC MYA-4621 / FGSC 9543 / NRRL 43880) TaxID=246409 RepID=I1C8E8_RHIO9|nr:hypothetical protein RO3G_09438 [Rhizopus delemar RA 99-880]|eukprot:EIE84728.1 hypothetical protein RO3G_09438 [Rhizopus delemar RA 99-880]
MSYLHTIQAVETAQCRLCQKYTDTTEHFLVLYPRKHPIWSTILQKF